MNIVLATLLIGAGVAAITWGVDRYRTHFAKRELLLGLIIGVSLILFTLFPVIFEYIAYILNIGNRFTATTLLALIFLVGLVLYLFTLLLRQREDITELSRSLTLKEIEQNPLRDGGQNLISIIIPAYNEAGNIPTVLDSLPDEILGCPVEVVVVSDGSEDGTATRARKSGATVVEHPINQGQGGALKTGFAVAEKLNSNIVVTMDADGQHPSESIDTLVRPILADEADFVMGSRFLGTDRSGNGVVRQTGIRFFTRLINLLTKSSITDCTNGFRAVRGSALDALTLTEEKFNAPELIIEARKNGLRVDEVPITVYEREKSETKKPSLMYAFGLTRTIFMTWIR